MHRTAVRPGGRIPEAGLSVSEITGRRQGEETRSVIAKLHSRLLLKLRPEEQEYQRSLFTTALNYLKNNWDLAMTYLKDGRYPMDNNAAERNVRPFCSRRKTFEHFGSDAGAEMAACYHSVISTFKAQGRSVWDGLRKVFGKVIDKTEDFLEIFSPHPAILPG